LVDWLPLLMVGMLGLIAVALIGFAVRYNALVQARVRTQEAWSGINVQLQRRADLVPNLVEAVRGYAGHERATFDDVARARGSVQRAAGPIEATAANLFLAQALGQLFAVVEAYPELKASRSFAALMDDLSDVEEKIAFARQFYNMNVLGLNTRIGTVPDLLYARLLGFSAFPFFDADAGAEVVPHVSFAPALAGAPPAEAPHA
jgi:LemA protein